VRARLESKNARLPNDYFARDRRGRFFQRIGVVHSAPEGHRKNFVFFCCLQVRFLCKIAENNAWMARGPDITPGSAVQNILKKVKKRLVSPIKPR
jgi:hypothetical protein